MVGGSPIFGFNQPEPLPPGWTPQARLAQQIPANAPAFASRAKPAPESMPVRPRPVVRMQAEDDPPPAREKPRELTMPAPEQLGIRPANTMPPIPRGLMERYGAACYHLKLASGWRVMAILPTKQKNVIHRVEAEAATEEDALRLLQDRVESWARGN